MACDVNEPCSLIISQGFFENGVLRLKLAGLPQWVYLNLDKLEPSYPDTPLPKNITLEKHTEDNSWAVISRRRHRRS